MVTAIVPAPSGPLSTQHPTSQYCPKIKEYAYLEMTLQKSAHTGLLGCTAPRGTIHIPFQINSTHGVHTMQMVPRSCVLAELHKMVPKLCIRMTWGVYRNYGFWASLILRPPPFSFLYLNCC